MGWLGGAYLWVQALHVIAVIAWMAGMLYLPRLYVYHAGATPGGELSETLKVMERRLLRAIVNPAMIASWVLGLALFVHLGAWAFGWMHAKLLLLVLLQVMHAVFARWRKDFANDANKHDAKVYRIANEVPTLLLIGIVILVIVKPF
ncbi:putative membrane protein [Limimonas halophila]|uniref:Protoporphyrinogen IX oxidase n=1 Tax=Limimonas halophila TaxID=1082479 RepID=A0A1G7SPP6_9PROT|nr:protoporphyrinogen oxidase HemJ [Limimonas halophila]SDG24250.1 putative membrane protein [Limimonas halophila]